MCAATRRAARRSGLPGTPTAKVLNGRFARRAASAAMIEEIEPAREEPADLDVGDQPFGDRLLEHAAQLAPDRLHRSAGLELGGAVGHAEPAPYAVGAVEQRAGRDRLDRGEAEAVERLELGGEREPAALPCEVERLNAERVARRDHPLGRREHEGEHAVEPRNPARRGRAEQMQDGLAVALRREPLRAECRPQIGVIVNLAVGDQHVVAPHDRLRSRLRTDDRKPAMRHHRGHARQLYDLQLVRPAMGDLLHHPPRERGIPRPPQAHEAAHAEPPSPRNAACPTAPASAGLQAPGEAVAAAAALA